MPERGNWFGRGSGPRDEFSKQRGSRARHPFVAREDAERQKEMARMRQDHPFMRTVAQLAVVVGGAYLLGRAIPRDALRNALDALGQTGREGLTAVRQGLHGTVRGAVGAFPEYKGLERAFMGAENPTYGDLELVGVLDEIMNVRQGHSATKGFAKGLRPSRAGGPVGSFDAIVQEHIAGKFLRSHPDHARLRHVTVGDVMASADLSRKIGERQFKVLKEGLAEGLITDKMALNTLGGDSTSIGLFKDGSSRIIDTRWASRQNIGKGIYNVASRFQILGFRPAHLFTALAQPFKQGEFFGELGAGVVVGRGQRLKGEGIKFAIGGKLYQQAGFDLFQEMKSEKAFKIFKVGEGQSTHTMEAFMALMGEHPLQKRALSYLDPADRAAHPIKQFWNRAQEVVGFGPGFKTRPHVVQQLVIDPLRRMEAIRKGGAYVPFREGVIRGRGKEGFGYVARRHVRKTGLDQIMDNLAGLKGQEGVLAHPGVDGNPLNARVRKAFGKAFGIDDIDELDAMFGVEHRGVVLDKAGLEEFHKTGVIKGASRAIDPQIGRAGFGSRLRRPGEVAEVKFGRLSPRTTLRTYVTHDDVLTSASLLTNQLTMRLNDLTSALMNYGFRPAEGHFGAAVNLARIYGGYKAIDYGIDYLGYMDYLSEKYTGISPKKLALQGYVHARTGLQMAREAVGVTAAAEWMEDTMPGSVDSPLSQGMRFGLPISLTAFRKSRHVAALGAVAGMFFGYGDVTKSSSQIKDEMIGERDVEYRRGRWWMLGRQPFGGGQIDYYGPSWIARQLSDYRYTDVQYGSKSAYWQNVSTTPTPSNLFGLLADPKEYMAQKHYFTRPYPYDAEGRPARMAEMIMDAEPPERDVVPSAPSRMGIPEYGNIAVPRADGPYGPGGKLGHLADKISELGGIYKFALWDAPGFGRSNGRPAATPDAMSSEGREYYDDQLGGMLGLTEAWRRFVPDEKWSRAYNTIPNMMPTWVPGMRSDFERDKTYYLDYTLGDPFTKIKHGEARMPGPGYEALHRLHSGTPGTYDAMDRFLILADIAPYSEAYRHYKTIVSSWAKAGVLDNYWQSKFDLGVEQVKNKLQKYDFTARRFTGLIDADEEELRRVEDWGILRKGLASAWEVGTHDVVSRMRDAVPLVGPLLGDKLAPMRSPIEMYKKWEIYGEDFADWRTPWKSFIRPKMHELIAQDPATATAGGAMLGMFGADPLSKLILSTVGAAAFGTASGARAIQTGRATGGYIPGHRQEERDAKEFLDHIKYAKYRRLEQMARAAGDNLLASQYKRLSGRTITGLNYNLPLEQFRVAARASMDKRERAYFDAFAHVTDPKARREIRSMLPRHLRSVYNAAWSKMGDPMRRHSQKYAQMSADEKNAAYWAQVTKPEADWAGWHPSVSQSDIAIRITHNQALDMHRFNLWESQEITSRTRFPDLEVPVNMGQLRRRSNHFGAAQSTATFKAMRFEGGSWRDGFQADGVSWDVIPEKAGEAIRQAGRLLMGG
jgi:hypothetical protein